MIINKSIDLCVVPSVWKSANITPIQKKKGDTSLMNHRPISILPTLSKLLEKFVQHQLLDHLTEFDVLSKHQSGFRPCHSTQDVLLHVTDSWRRAIDNKDYVGAVFLDLAKAFDCVDHAILISKLPYYGLDGKVLLWIQNYLTDRTQRVYLENDQSAWSKVAIGVPQGSILGPLLFTLYINDLPTVINHCDVNIYADDTEIHSSNSSLPTLTSHIQEDLDSVDVWMSSNRLRVNPTKTVSMLIGPHQKIRNRTLDVSLSNTKICSVTSTKYLGVYIDCHLTWDEHVQYVLKRVRGKLASIARLKPLPSKVIALLYKTFVVPIFDYCDTVWQPNSLRMSNKLDQLHERAIRLILSSRSTNSNLKLPSSPSTRRRYHVAIQAFKVLHRLSPPYLLSALNYTKDITNRTSKSIYRVFVPFVRTNFGKSAFYFKSTSIWNSLNSALYACNDLKQFKFLYKSIYNIN